MTASIRRILCPVDLGPAAFSVLHRAASIAATFGATLEALHVRTSSERAPWTPFQSRTQLVESVTAAHAMEQRLSQVVADAHAKAHVSTKVLDGTPVATILAEAQSAEADLLVVGAARRSSWRQRPGTGYELSRRARCGVLTVPVDVPSIFAGRILLPVDFSVATDVALDWTILLARTFGSHVDVLHALPPEAKGSRAGASSLKRPRLTVALRRLAAVVARLREAGVSDTTSVVVEGDTLDAILARNESESAGLIVMGSHAVTQQVRNPDAAPGTIAWVRASLAVPVLSVRSAPVSAEWQWQDLRRGGGSLQKPNVVAVPAALSY